MITNIKSRSSEQGHGDTFDGQMLWILWRHIRRTDRMNVRIPKYFNTLMTGNPELEVQKCNTGS